MRTPAKSPGISVTIVATCMGRLDFLKRALPTWLEFTSFPVVIVDYSCPDGVGAWVESAGFGRRVTVVREEVRAHQGRLLFNLSRARNAGARAVHDGHLLFLDADTHVNPGFQKWVEGVLDPGAMFAVVGKIWALFGVLGVPVQAFRAVGGYDEGFEGWGCEDVDLRIRLHCGGLKCAAIPEHLLRSIPHSSVLRTQNSIETDFNRMRRITEEYLDRKLRRTTGRSYASWYSDKTIHCLSNGP